ncbi:MAG: murein biosynthesis integral membrane protein MurJ, partial [Hyphomicrobium sp.]|nr:murein biosynthesis integral membrane protein MurJ [Hyphomicrobium sp.]
PLFSRRLEAGGRDDAQAFSNEILAVFMPALLLVTIVFVIFMPGLLAIVAAGYKDTPGKMELAVELTRWTFPYLLFISLVALLSGVLNSLTRFAVAAFAPALLNVSLIIALLVAPRNEIDIVRYMAIAVLAGGIAQFALCWVAVRRAGIRLHFGRPRMTPAVRELVVLILPATAAAGVYQISQLFYGYFSTRLGEGALTNLSYADRLNQLPLSIIGTALGVAILPSISQAIERKDEAGAADVQARAFDLAMLLTLPATLALVVAAGPIIGALFQGGEYSVADARTTGNILAILVTGLPAYVLVKVLTPAFYARKNVKTPVKIAMSVLLLSVPANFLLIPHLGIYSLAT